jgi:hypothetical protein
MKHIGEGLNAKKVLGLMELSGVSRSRFCFPSGSKEQGRDRDRQAKHGRRQTADTPTRHKAQGAGAEEAEGEDERSESRGTPAPEANLLQREPKRRDQGTTQTQEAKQGNGKRLQRRRQQQRRHLQ